MKKSKNRPLKCFPTMPNENCSIPCFKLCAGLVGYWPFGIVGKICFVENVLVFLDQDKEGQETMPNGRKTKLPDNSL
jgi:hypothetical protein